MRRAAHLETAATLSEALQTCMAEPVDHLVINMSPSSLRIAV